MSKEAPVEESGGPDHVEYGDWCERLEAGTLLGLECRTCGHVTATPKRACIECGARDLTGVELPTRGEVYSETIINVAPEGVDGPYQVAVIDLGPTRLLARIDGEVGIGDAAEFAGSIDATGSPAPVFEPTD